MAMRCAEVIVHDDSMVFSGERVGECPIVKMRVKWEAPTEVYGGGYGYGDFAEVLYKTAVVLNPDDHPIANVGKLAARIVSSLYLVYDDVVLLPGDDIYDSREVKMRYSIFPTEEGLWMSVLKCEEGMAVEWVCKKPLAEYSEEDFEKQNKIMGAISEQGEEGENPTGFPL